MPEQRKMLSEIGIVAATTSGNACEKCLPAEMCNLYKSAHVTGWCGWEHHGMVERKHIDMVVISTHGISGWHPFVFGSIAEKVVKLVQCPLLLLRSPKPGTGAKIPSGRASEW